MACSFLFQNGCLSSSHCVHFQVSRNDERGESTLFKDVFQKSMAFPVISFLRRTWSFSQVTLVKLGGELAVGSWLQKLFFFFGLLSLVGKTAASMSFPEFQRVSSKQLLIKGGGVKKPQGKIKGT